MGTILLSITARSRNNNYLNDLNNSTIVGLEFGESALECKQLRLTETTPHKHKKDHHHIHNHSENKKALTIGKIYKGIARNTVRDQGTVTVSLHSISLLSLFLSVMCFLSCIYCLYLTTSSFFQTHSLVYFLNHV